MNDNGEFQNENDEEYSELESDNDSEIIPIRKRRTRYLSDNDSESMKNWAHFPEYIPSTKSKEHHQKRCHVCFKHHIRKDTGSAKNAKYRCISKTCFEKYHTLQNY